MAIRNLKQFIEQVTGWQEVGPDRNSVEWVWYRGQADKEWEPLPTVERPWFQNRAREHIQFPKEQQLSVERSINKEFRRLGAMLLPGDDLVKTYFLSQHYGLDSGAFTQRRPAQLSRKLGIFLEKVVG